MKSKIILGFPGIGKSYFHKNNKENSIDLDFSTYYWKGDLHDTDKHPDFPNNYLSDIKDAIGKYEYILVSSQKDILKAMQDASIFFYLIYPNHLDKNEYMLRYKNRQNTDYFLDLVDSQWDKWTRTCRGTWTGCENIEFPLSDTINWYLSDIIKGIK